MHAIDWAIVVVPLVVVLAISRMARPYVHGVADFLAAGRSAGRYLVCVGEGMAGVGLITAVGSFEMFYQAGTAVNWFTQLGLPITVLITLSGFIIYRYRETRALTLAQFFEARYSRRFRVFMGTAAWVAGVLNYGIFPVVGARFFIYFCKLPPSFDVLGVTVQSYIPLMALFLGLALGLVLGAGQIQVLITDCVQGLFCGIFFCVVAFTVLRLFSLEQMFQAMSNREHGRSLLNPFDTTAIPDFNIWYVLIGLFGLIYLHMSWQGNQGYNASALNAHEAKMGKILANWRNYAQSLVFLLLGIAAVTYLRAPAFAAGQEEVRATLSTIGSAQVRTQMLVPAALGQMLPVGVTGCLAAMMLFLMVSTDTTYLHSWGSIFVQDVLLPLRGERPPLSPRQHLAWLRWSIASVAAFAFGFGIFFPTTDYIFMFFNVTGAIFTGGSGAAIIGGLYWSRGSTAGAWGAMLVGSSLAVAGVVLPWAIPTFPLNGTEMSFVAMASAIATYVGLSLLSRKGPHDMDALLHRGGHAVAEDAMAVRNPSEDRTKGDALERPLQNWTRLLLGYDRHFTATDKWISGGFFGLSMVFFVGFVVITLWNVLGLHRLLGLSPWTERMWWNWSLVQMFLAVVLAPVTTVWFTVGGVRDLRRLFHVLRTRPRDADDDGTVIDGRNADDVERDDDAPDDNAPDDNAPDRPASAGVATSVAASAAR